MGGVCSRKPSLKQDKKRTLKNKITQFAKETDIREKYLEISVIGSGSFGKVRLYKDKFSRSRKFAIKTLNKSNLPDLTKKFIEDEVNILRELDHPNIVKYFETYEDEKSIHLVMEYIPGDDLFKVIYQRRMKKFTEKDVLSIIKCIFKALFFLHSKKIVHRDIKPENILFSIPGDYSSLKIIDFGLSTSSDIAKSKYRVGSPYYMAPEMIEGEFGTYSDVWSVGVIIFIMLTGKYPFNGKNPEDVFARIRSGVWDQRVLDKQKVSKNVKDLIKSILVIDPTKRPSVEECLGHPWFTEKEEKDIEIDLKILESLKKFSNTNLFQKEVFYILATISNDKDLLKLTKAFIDLDKDHTGTIEIEEVEEAFKSQGITLPREELDNIWKSLDFHNDGEVNYSEFLASTLNSMKFFKEERLLEAFRFFDPDNKGFITFESFVSALKSKNIPINEEELNHFFRNLKEENKIDFFTFKDLLSN